MGLKLCGSLPQLDVLSFFVFFSLVGSGGVWGGGRPNNKESCFSDSILVPLCMETIISYEMRSWQKYGPSLGPVVTRHLDIQVAQIGVKNMLTTHQTKMHVQISFQTVQKNHMYSRSAESLRP